MTNGYIEKESNYWLKIIADGLLLVISFSAVYFFRRGHLLIESQFQKVFLLLTIIWFVITLFSKKFMQVQIDSHLKRIKPFFLSILVMVFISSLSLYVLGWYHLSRFIIYGTLAVFLILEIGFWCIWICFSPSKNKNREQLFSVLFFLIEMATIISTFLILYGLRKGTLQLRENYLLLLMGIFFTWLLISFLSHQFTITRGQTFIKTLIPFWKSEILIFGLIATALFTLNLAGFSRFIILGSLLIFVFMENMIVTLYFMAKKKKPTDEVEVKLFKAKTTEYQPLLKREITAPFRLKKYYLPHSRIQHNLLRDKLKTVFLKKFPAVFSFIDTHIDLRKFSILKSVILYTRSSYNYEILDNNTLQLVLNLRELNDYRRINQILIEVNSKLKANGVFIGRFQSLRQSKNKYFKKYPYLIAKLLQIFLFLFKRLLPKLPVLKKIYFAVSKGYRRFISKAEALGRLYFCGFEVLDLEIIDNFTWFIVKKINEPVSDTTPSYGMLFKQKRIGKNGKFIFIYKMRTMHPFSEFIHQYIYSRHQLDEKGKIKDDFRITGWGRVLRKLYLDELPMVINWLKGEVKLVGVRPLSETIYSTYPKRLQKERIKHKPGLIPPYYVDMPNCMDEVLASERKYLKKYSQHPLRTDMAYFFKALKNIFFHHAKSS